MRHLNDGPCAPHDATPDLDPVVTALRTQQWFNREQVEWLMRLAGRWGYETRVDEENAGYPEPPIIVAGKLFDQVDYRRQCDQAARLPRPGDHRGGPVEPWGDDAQVAA